MAKLVLPRVQAMVLCDAVREADEEGDVYHLSGVRSGMNVLSFPALRPRLCIFLQMSGHEGSARCHIEINESATEEIVFQTSAKEIVFKKPTEVTPVVFRLRNCMFPSGGLYFVQVFHDRKLIGERPLYVQQEG